MKKERRHDLQTNLLADYLGKKIEQIKPYTNLIVGGVLVVGVIVAVWVAIAWFRGGNEEEAWATYDRSMSPAYALQVTQQQTASIEEEIKTKDAQIKPATDEATKARYEKERTALERRRKEAEQAVRDKLRKELQSVMNDYPDSPAGWAATLRLAEQSLNQAVADLFESGAAETNLDTVVTYYETAKRNIDDPMLRQWAQLCLARAYEARNLNDPQKKENDDTERAKREYKQLVEESAAYGPEAKRRLAVLESKDSFHEWLDRALDERSVEKRPLGSTTAGFPSGLTTP